MKRTSEKFDMDIDKGINICTREVSAYSSDERKDVYLSVAGQHTSLYTRDLCVSEGGFEGHCGETSPPRASCLSPKCNI